MDADPDAPDSAVVEPPTPSHDVASWRWVPVVGMAGTTTVYVLKTVWLLEFISDMMRHFGRGPDITGRIMLTVNAATGAGIAVLSAVGVWMGVRAMLATTVHESYAGFRMAGWVMFFIVVLLVLEMLTAVGLRP